jgi:hypothetical protein
MAVPRIQHLRSYSHPPSLLSAAMGASSPAPHPSPAANGKTFLTPLLVRPTVHSPATPCTARLNTTSTPSPSRGCRCGSSTRPTSDVALLRKGRGWSGPRVAPARPAIRAHRMQIPVQVREEPRLLVSPRAFPEAAAARCHRTGQMARFSRLPRGDGAVHTVAEE